MTVRLRLTLLYTALFLAAGVLLLATVYLFVAHAAWPRDPDPPDTPTVDLPGDGLEVDVDEPGAPVLSDALDQQRDEDLRQLLAGSTVALAAMAVASAALGWIVAGRVLRPIATMTTQARRISADNLHERLAAPGPEDELKALSDTVDDLLDRLEAAFESQRRFVANASHELRTPLTVQRALVEVALADPDADAEHLRDACRAALDNVEDQQRMIDALLVLARSQRGLDRHVPIDLADVVHREVDARRGDVARRNLRTTIQLDPAETAGDPELVERLVANLLDNAIRHNVDGGWIEVSAASTVDTALIRVANDSVRIEPDQIAGLLAPFRRHRPDRSHADNDGHGLGLSIVDAIVRAHRGHLTVSPVPDGGLTVEVRLPGGENADKPPRSV